MKQKKERFFLLLMMYCNGSIDGKGGATAPVATITLAITVLHDYLLFVVALPFWLGPFLPYPHCPTLVGCAAARRQKRTGIDSGCGSGMREEKGRIREMKRTAYHGRYNNNASICNNSIPFGTAKLSSSFLVECTNDASPIL
jgi:hypothetical protein